MKIVQILQHSTPASADFETYWYDGWHIRVGRAISKIASNADIICVRPEIKADGPVLYKDKYSDITIGRFPAKKICESFELSLDLLKFLKNISKAQDVIFHFHDYRAPLQLLTAALFNKNVKMVGQHHGMAQTTFLINKSAPHKAIFYSLKALAEKIIVPNYRCLFALNNEELNYVERLGVKSARIQTMGVDCDTFKPIKKSHARKILGLDGNSKYVLYVGRLEKIKGADAFIDALCKVKRYADVRAIVVGATEKDTYYEKAKSLGATFFQNQPNKLMPLFYNAADIFVQPIFCTTGGFNVALLEALACNTTTISTMLDRYEPLEITSLGLFPKSFADVSNMLLNQIESPHKFKPRDAIARRYSWEAIAKATLNVYEQL